MKSIRALVICCAIKLLLNQVVSVNSEFFSSVYHMESLVESEKYLIDTLDYFITEEEKLLVDLKRFKKLAREDLNYVNMFSLLFQ